MTKEQKMLIDRINKLCNEKEYSYYTVAYRGGIPLTTFTHIMDGTSKNPGIFTIYKICDGLDVSMADFFNTKEFRKMSGNLEERKERWR